jgi:hypothetical protein
MTQYHFASEIPGFDPSDSNVIEESHGDAFGRANTKSSSSSSYLIVDGMANLTDFYTHFFMDRNLADTSTTLRQCVIWLDASANELFRMRWNSTSYDFAINIASTWTTLGTITVYPFDPQEIDIHMNIAVSGTFTVYIAGTERLSYSGDLSAAAAGIAEARFYGSNNTSSNASYHGLVVANVPTIGYRLATFYPNGAGASTDWTNSFSNIDETVHNDADFVYSGTANQVATYSATGPSLTGYSVRAVGVSARAKRGATGPANMQLVLRAGTTNYLSSTIALSVGYQTIANIWETNPDTAADFLSSEISALQPGIKSIT